ncbi:MAG: EamA family transporter [Anaeromyxobacter sp.]
MARPAVSNVALFVIPSVIWGTTWLAIKFQLGLVAPEVSVTWRFALAGALIVAWCALRGVPLRFSPRDHAGFALLGALLFGVNYVLTYRSEQYLTSGLVAVIFAFIVFWNLLGAWLLFGTRPPRAVVAGAALGVGGVALLFWPEVASLRAGASGGQAAGMGLAVVATLLASGGNLYSQRLFRRGLPVLPATGLSMAYSAAMVAGWCAVTGVPFTFDARPGYVLSLLYLACFGSVVAFLTYLTLVHRIGAGRAGYTSAVTPAVAMAISTAFEGYRWTPGTLAGMALVLGGTVLVLRARATAAPR